MTQLDMFGAPPAARGTVAPTAVGAELHALGRALPPQVALGTSSWSFPGWAGLVYAETASESTLARHGLAAYAQHPLLRAVGIDRSFYAPLAAADLAAYAAVVPPDFRFVMKAHDLLTMARVPDHPRHGALRGGASPHYLDVGHARDAVVAPFVEGLGPRGAVVLFQFAPQPAEVLAGPGPRTAPRRFAERLYRFLRDLPRGPRYAVELRTAELLTPDYGAALRAAGAVPCLALLPGMPDLDTQYQIAGAADGDALVIRWMLALHHDYESAGAAYQPFSAIVDPDPRARRSIAARVRDTVARDRPAIVIVNNNAEGSSPCSIVALAREIV